MTAGQRHRLPHGGLVDRSRILSFRFEGKSYTGYAGDTLASALLANGVRLVGRSFKYHRPRGIVAAGADEPNALIQMGRDDRSSPNMRATEVRLFDGLECGAVNCWPSVRWDAGRINDLAGRFLAAGFYYKTFMWPTWRLYESSIRKAAGLGRLTGLPDPDRYERRYAHCDVLVVGAGPAGLAAARSAAETGARVMVAEQDSTLGGQLLWDGGEIDGMHADDWARAQERHLRTHPNVTVLPNTVVAGYFDHNYLTMVEAVSGDDPKAAQGVPRYRLWEVRAGRVILATGTIERPLVFPGNDRPGVMLAGAVRHYLGRYAVRPGDRAVVFTNNDEAYRTAVAFRQAGGEIAAVVDVRHTVPAGMLTHAASMGIEVIAGGEIVHTKGFSALRSVTVRTGDGSRRRLECDLLAVSGGRNPALQLLSQAGGKLAFDESRLAFLPGRSTQRAQFAGSAAGTQTLSEALGAGHAASAVSAAPGEASSTPPVATQEYAEAAIAPCWSVDAPGKAFVDLLNDVTKDDIGLAAREGYVSVEHLKRYTTLGMGVDQGKTSNVNALAIMAEMTGRTVPETGTTRSRFPYVPVALGAFAGRGHGDLFRVRRRLPMHDWHIANGAEMDDFGWLRPAAYPLPGEDRHAACVREVRTVRTGVGIFDGSPLGKIEVRGRDAARFLDFLYANAMSTLKIGRSRYGIMLNERGIIIDDGVCTRLGEDHFLVGTSSAEAGRIHDWMEEWLQCEFVQYDVLVAPVTTNWGVITLAGPHARALLARAPTDIDLDRRAFPHMGFREGRLCGVPVRLSRVSYTGELSYEIAAPTRDAPALWEALYRLGREDDLAPVGIEAWNLLRLEKGYLHIGGDTDGTSTPLNVGWDHVLDREGDFAGKRSLMLPVNQEADRLQLVGLRSSQTLPIGAHAVGHAEDAGVSDGFVTSSGFSATLGEPVALAMIRGGHCRIGAAIEVVHLGQRTQAEICDPVRYDREGARLRV